MNRCLYRWQSNTTIQEAHDMIVLTLVYIIVFASVVVSLPVHLPAVCLTLIPTRTIHNRCETIWIIIFFFFFNFANRQI